MARILIIISFLFCAMSSSAQEMACDSAVVQTSDSIIVQKMRQAGVKFYKHNQVKLLKSGSAKFHDMLKAISLAESSVHLDYFNFRNDSIAKRLFRHLAERSANGVEVRAIYDSFGNMSNSRPLKKKHLKTIEGWGIEIREFDKIKFPWVNHVWRHDHRKIVVIDGKVAYSGGMNVADYYVDGLPKIGPWRDMHFRVQGPVINEYQKTFFGNWNTLTRQNIHGAKYYCGIDSVEHSFLPDEFNDSLHTDVMVGVVSRLPVIQPKIMRQMYIEAIDAAQYKIQIISPYFVPCPSIKKAIKRALKRGVDVQIMLSAKSDIPLTPDAGFYVANKLRKKGAQYYLYQNGFHHSKIMMVDDLFCTIGSANLDSRSLKFDYEINALFIDKGVTKELSDMYEIDKLHSVRQTSKHWKKKPFLKKFVAWFGYLLGPFI